MTRSALVAGATGLVGSELLRQLAENPAYGQITALVRREPQAGPPGVRFITTDFANLETFSDELHVDDVYCCLGTTLRAAGSRAAFERVDHAMVTGLARAAHTAGARQFIVISAAGTAPTSPSFYSRVKARMEADVSSIPYRAVHILRPSLLLGVRGELRPSELAGQKLAPLLAPVMLGPLRKYRPVHAADVASAMIELAMRDAGGVHVHHLPLD